MEFLVPKKAPSSFPAPSPETHQQRHPAETSGGSSSPVTSCLYLRASSGEDDEDRTGQRRTLDKDLVLRRIRHHRRATHTRDAAQTASLRLAGGGEGWRGDWMDEGAFFSP